MNHSRHQRYALQDKTSTTSRLIWPITHHQSHVPRTTARAFPLRLGVQAASTRCEWFRGRALLSALRALGGEGGGLDIRYVRRAEETDSYINSQRGFPVYYFISLFWRARAESQHTRAHTRTHTLRDMKRNAKHCPRTTDQIYTRNAPAHTHTQRSNVCPCSGAGC